MKIFSRQFHNVFIDLDNLPLKFFLVNRQFILRLSVKKPVACVKREGLLKLGLQEQNQVELQNKIEIYDQNARGF